MINTGHLLIFMTPVLMLPMKGADHWRVIGNVSDFDARSQGEGIGDDVPVEVIAHRH